VGAGVSFWAAVFLPNTKQNVGHCQWILGGDQISEWFLI
jgi:hypothetical protein